MSTVDEEEKNKALLAHVPLIEEALEALDRAKVAIERAQAVSLSRSTRAFHGLQDSLPHLELARTFVHEARLKA
jgi:hypothetical protein